MNERLTACEIEEILREKLTAEAVDAITKSKKDFSDWIDQMLWINKRCDELAREVEWYRGLEKQGLLLILPCKIGDAVYVKLADYCKEIYAEAEVRDFSHFASCGFCIVVTSKCFDKQNIPFTEFGKTIFLTKEEAEENLRKLRHSI